MRLQPGIRLECLGNQLRRSVVAAARLKAKAAQFTPVGDLSPNKLSTTGRREIRHLLQSNGLELAALHCPLRGSLGETEDQQPRLEKIRKVMDLAAALNCPLVTLHAGKIPTDDKSKEKQVLEESARFLISHGDKSGVSLGMISGPDSPEVFTRFLSSFDTGALGAVIDPAGLQLYDFDPCKIVHTLAQPPRLVLARELAVTGRVSREVALGTGGVEWPGLLGSLHEKGFRGALLLSREEALFPLAEMEASWRFIHSFIPST